MGGCGQSIPVPLCCSFLLTLFPCGPSYGLQSFDINLLQHGLSSSHHSFRNDPMSPVLGHPQAAGITFSTGVFSMGCRRPSALAPGALPLPPSSLTLVFAGLFLTLLPPRSSPSLAVVSFLKYTFTEVPPALLMGSGFGQWWVHFGASWNQMCLAWRQPLASPHRGLHCTPPHPPRYQDVDMDTNRQCKPLTC